MQRTERSFEENGCPTLAQIKHKDLLAPLGESGIVLYYCKLKRYGLCVTLVGAFRDSVSDALLVRSAGAQRSIGSVKWASICL